MLVWDQTFDCALYKAYRQLDKSQAHVRFGSENT
jgi:hypothetical protein